MPESLVQVTEGSGKLLHTFQRTIGANTVEDEVLITGEPYLASYCMSMATNATTLNSHMIQVMAGATLKVRIRRIEIFQTAMATAVAIGVFYLMRVTTAGTGGTAVGSAPFDTSDAASGATGMTLPTVKGAEGVVLHSPTLYLMQTLAVSTPMPEPLYVWDFDRTHGKPLIIPAGAVNGIVIKNTAAYAAAGLTVNVWFDESNF